MSDNCDILFYIKPIDCNQRFIKGVIDVLLKAGCVYEPGDYFKSGYWSDKKGDWFWERPLSEAIHTISIDGGGAINLWYGKMCFTLGIRPKPTNDKKLGIISLTFDRVYLRDILDWDQKAETNIEIILKLGRKLYEYLSPIYGFGEYGIGWREIPSEDEILSGNIRHLCWANFFSPAFVQKIGREKLLSAPAWKVEELNDGGILLVLAPNPMNINEVDKKKKEVEKHLGIK